MRKGRRNRREYNPDWWCHSVLHPVGENREVQIRQEERRWLIVGGYFSPFCLTGIKYDQPLGSHSSPLPASCNLQLSDDGRPELSKRLFLPLKPKNKD